jgi:acetylornithine/N-succinyldiaminopimelate aminotransferase
VIEKEGLLEKVRVQSGPWHAALKKLAADFPKHVVGVRGVGYLVGIQLTSDPGPYIAAARERGLLAPASGNNVMRLLPPLNATAEELAKSVEIFRGVLAAKG